MLHLCGRMVLSSSRGSTHVHLFYSCIYHRDELFTDSSFPWFSSWTDIVGHPATEKVHEGAGEATRVQNQHHQTET